MNSPQDLLNCHIDTPWGANSQVKLQGAYTLPADIRVSATYQNLAGPPSNTTFVATNAQIAPSLGRNLAAGANGTVVVPAVAFSTAAPGGPFLAFRARQVPRGLWRIG